MSYILLIEDNMDNAQMMIRLLNSVGFRVEHATEGFDGASMANNELPDLILMDFNLPDVDGRILALTLKKRFAAKKVIPIIGVTARSGTFEKSMAERYGCDGFINKPFDPQTFLNLVMQFVKPPTPAPNEK